MSIVVTGGVQVRVTREMREQAAIHEAGHALVAWKLNMPVEHIQLVEEDEVADFIGAIRLPGRPDIREAERLDYDHGLIAYSVAGQVAECLRMGACGANGNDGVVACICPPNGVWTQRVCPDRVLAETYFPEIGGDPVALLAHHTLGVKKLLRANEAAHRRLSDALLSLPKCPHWQPIRLEFMYRDQIVTALEGRASS